MKDTLTTSLQQSVLTLIATNNTEGKIASGLLHTDDFDDDYRDVAERILLYRKKHSKAPGKAHLDDILDDILDNVSHKKYKQYMRITEGILAQASSLNSTYVLDRVNVFTRKQSLKTALLKAADIYQTDKDDVIDEVESVLYKALRPKNEGLESGTFFGDKKKVLGFLDNLKADYKTGIPELDRVNCGPTAKAMYMLMAAKGQGKSWWCVGLGKKCLLQGAKVLHVTLEMPEEQVIGRYVQSMWAIAKRDERYLKTKFRKDDLGRIEKFIRRTKQPKRSLDNPDINKFISQSVRRWGTRLNRLLIKEFPTKSLSVAKLDAYLDMLELRHSFIPNVLILDYPDLMFMEKTKDPRISIGWTIEELRGLLMRRNITGIMPTQTNRKGWDAKTVKGNMVAEDASKFRTADMILIYSRTRMEKKLGLARLFVEKNRNDEDGFMVAISQSYWTGQFCLSSAYVGGNYMQLVGPDTEEGEEDE